MRLTLYRLCGAVGHFGKVRTLIVSGHGRTYSIESCRLCGVTKVVTSVARIQSQSADLIVWDEYEDAAEIKPWIKP